MSFAMLMHAAHPAPPSPTAPVVRTSPVAVTTARPLGTTAAGNGYVEYLPPGYGLAKTRAPLLIALHGRGENGPGTAQALRQLQNNGITKIMHEGQWPASRPFVVLAPQHDGAGCPTAREVNAFLDFAKAHYQIDERRIYLTGLSCGARGIADYFAHYGAKEIAATVLIAGDLSPAWAKRDCTLARDVPLWVFHGADDDIVPATGDAATMEHLQSCPRHREMKFDMYPNTGHDAWTRAYATAHHDIYAWMLNYVRDDSRAAAVRGN